MSKSVSLKSIHQHFAYLTEQDFEHFTKNEEEYRQMWTQQGVEFWVQFTIVLREHVLHQSGKYDETCDKQFIRFLKALSFKNVTEIIKYVKNAITSTREIQKFFVALESIEDKLDDEKLIQLKVHMLTCFCAGSFVRVLSLWKEANEGHNFDYVPPKSWTICAICGTFEGYLRSRWGGFQNLDQILGYERHKIFWWNSPAGKFNYARKDEPEEGGKVTGSAWSAPAEYCFLGLEGLEPDDPYKAYDNDCSKVDMENKVYGGRPSAHPMMARPSGRKYGVLRPGQYKRKPWLPRLTEQWLIFEGAMMAQAAAQFARGQVPLQKMWPLFTYSFPPLLARKYHTVDAALMLCDGNVDHNVSVATWFVQWINVFNNRFMNFLHQGCGNLMSRSSIPDPMLRTMMMHEWFGVRERDQMVMENHRNDPSAPDVYSDCIEAASEFLLEPCVIVQLPWQPVLFRQWLAAACIEVFKLELETVEFRHWPLPKDFEPVVRHLLALVSTVKENLLLGWSVIAHEVTPSPDLDVKYPELILDRVVLPSLDALEFICSGKPVEIVRSLRKQCWSETQALDDKVSIPCEAYDIERSVYGIYVDYFFHHTFWDFHATETNPFPTYELSNDLNVEQQVQLIECKRRRGIPFSKKFSAPHPLSVDEEKSVEILQEAASKVSMYETSAILKKAQEVINVVVIKCGHFSKENCEKLLTIFNSEAATAAANEVPKNKAKRTPLEQALLSCSLYYNISMNLSANYQETSILSWLYRLGAQVVEREQIMRVIGACAVLLNQSPKICGARSGRCAAECNVEDVPEMTITEMTRTLEEVRGKYFTRDQLWAKFPLEWQKPVTTDHKTPILSEGIPAIAKGFENRIGRMVWNIAQKNFVVHGRGGEEYTFAQIVQYLLPCYISILLKTNKCPNTERINRKRQNLVNFLHQVVLYYEKSVNYWDEFCKSRYRPTGKLIPKFDPVRMRESTFMATYFTNILSYLMCAFAGLGRSSGSKNLIELNFIMFYLKDFANINIDAPVSKIQVYNGNSWLKYIFPHLKVLYRSCYRAFFVPPPTYSLRIPELQELYFASHVIHLLQAVGKIQGITHPDLNKTMKISEREQITITATEIDEWNHDLYCVIFETEAELDFPEELLAHFINNSGGREKLIKMYDFLKSHCRRLRLENVMKIEIPTYDCDLLVKFINAFYTKTLDSMKLFRSETTEYRGTGKVKSAPEKQVKCRKCETDGNVSSSIACKACVAFGVVDIAYFCSNECQQQLWQQHSDWHLRKLTGLQNKNTNGNTLPRKY